MAAGDFCMLLIGSANRDPAAFDRPEELDITRSENPHLGFGFGLHHCLGAPLARIEAQIALGTLLRRTEIHGPVGELVAKDNIVLRGLEHLPVELAAR
jgi:cytochrome P450